MKQLTGLFLFLGIVCYTGNAQMHRRMAPDSSYFYGMRNRMMRQNQMWGNMPWVMHYGMFSMMGGMRHMCIPMQKYFMIVAQLPEMQEELSLDKDQTDKLIDFLAAFMKQRVDILNNLNQLQTNLQTLLSQNAPINEIKNQLKDYSDASDSLCILAYTTAKQMENVLTKDQLSEFENTYMKYFPYQNMYNMMDY